MDFSPGAFQLHPTETLRLDRTTLCVSSCILLVDGWGCGWSGVGGRTRARAGGGDATCCAVACWCWAVWRSARGRPRRGGSPTAGGRSPAAPPAPPSVTASRMSAPAPWRSSGRGGPTSAWWPSPSTTALVPQWTPMVLDTLAQHQVPATFFLVGAQVRQHAHVVRTGSPGTRSPTTAGSISTWPDWTPTRPTERPAPHATRRSRTWPGRSPVLLRPPYGHLAGAALLAAAAAGLSTRALVAADAGARVPQRPGRALTRYIVAQRRRPGTILLGARRRGRSGRLIALRGLPAMIQRTTSPRGTSSSRSPRCWGRRGAGTDQVASRSVASTLSVLTRNRDFRRLFVAELVVFGADWFVMVPLLVLLPELTGSGAGARWCWPRTPASSRCCCRTPARSPTGSTAARS